MITDGSCEDRNFGALATVCVCLCLCDLDEHGKVVSGAVALYIGGALAGGGLPSHVAPLLLAQPPRAQPASAIRRVNAGGWTASVANCFEYHEDTDETEKHVIDDIVIINIVDYRH